MSSQSWVGRTIGGRYQLEDLMGAGGMSAVYRAYDPNLRRTVAVKLIHPHLSDNPNFVNRFKEEAAAVASLRHPNIVQVHDFNNEGDTYYMVMDFGIVKIVGGQYHTATGATIGTAIYMSPEQIRGERVDERADIYSMGVMLFEMLNGRPPFEADSTLTLMMMHLNDPVPDLDDLRLGLPSRLVGVTVKALAKERSQRYQTAAEMADDLRQAAAELTASLTQPQDKLSTQVGESVTQAGESVAREPLPPIPGGGPALQASEPGQQSEPTEAGDYTGIPLPTGQAQPEEVLPVTLPMEAPGEEAVEPEVPGMPQEQAVPGQPAIKQHAFEQAETELGTGEAVLPGEAVQAQTPAPEPDRAVSGEPVPSLALPMKEATAGKAPGQGKLPRRLGLFLTLAILAVVVLATLWVLNGRRPPRLQLMPIERPSEPITL